jgi:hypothetical protein
MARRASRAAGSEAVKHWQLTLLMLFGIAMWYFIILGIRETIR